MRDYPGVLFQLGMPLPLAIIITLLLGAICGLINAGLIIYTGVNPLVITPEPCIYLVVAHYCYLVWLAPRVMKVLVDFPQRSLTLPIFHFLVFPCRLFFLVCCLFFWLLMHRTYGTQRFPDWPERPCRAVQRDPGESHVVYRVCHDRMRLRDRRRITGFLLWLRTFGSGRLFPDAGHYGGCAGRRQYLWRLRVDYGVRVGGAAGGILQQGLQMAGVPNQISSALSGALLIVVVVGRSVSLHRHQILEWYSRRRNAHQA